MIILWQNKQDGQGVSKNNDDNKINVCPIGNNLDVDEFRALFKSFRRVRR
jgi:hypothetical protein